MAAIQRSRQMPVPAIETGLWKHRTFALANGASFLYGTSLYAWMLLGVLVLTQLWHYSELQAGLAMTPGAIAASVAAVAAGRRATPRTAVAAGAALMAASGLFIAATLPTHGEFLTYWLPVGLVLGAGMGMVTTGTSTAAALSVPPQSFAAGTGLNQTARQVGGALGVATLATLVRSGGAGAGGHVRPRVRVLLAGRGGRGAGGTGARAPSRGVCGLSAGRRRAHRWRPHRRADTAHNARARARNALGVIAGVAAVLAAATPGNTLPAAIAVCHRLAAGAGRSGAGAPRH